MADLNLYKKTGYLNSNFKIFHIIDKHKKIFKYHYHDFFKILIFINGNVTYHIEGKSYNLNAYDIVLVNPSEIHKPVIHDDTPYERIVIYISPEFFHSCNKKNFDLSFCFINASKNKANIINYNNRISNLYYEIDELKSYFENTDVLNNIYRDAIFIKFMVLLNKYIKNNFLKISSKAISNKKVLEVLSYINDNLSSDININDLAARFYLNRSYLMHLFKKETGYTIIQYITEKRLFKARSLILKGYSLTDACFYSGFKNYSTFFRSFKNKFNVSPKDISLLEHF